MIDKIDKKKREERKKKYLNKYTPDRIEAKNKSERNYKTISEAKKDGNKPPNKPLENIPKSVLDNLDQLPESSMTKEKSKLIDIKVGPDGSCETKSIIINGKEKDPKHRSIAGVISPSDDELLKIEQKRIRNNNLHELAERTLDKHKDQDYWKEIKQKINNGDVEVKWK